MADDDVGYHLIVKCALKEIGFRGTLQTVRDGVELMDYLCRRGKYRCARTPDLLILDLGMPGKDGRSALREIKADPSHRLIPVAVMTSSTARKDIELCRRFSKCSYTRKPATYKEWIRSLEDILSANLPPWDPADPEPYEEANHCNSSE